LGKSYKSLVDRELVDDVFELEAQGKDLILQLPLLLGHVQIGFIFFLVHLLEL